MLEMKVLTAAKTLSNQWIPVNVARQKAIAKNLSIGKYERNISGLVTDLMSDVALFGHCYRYLLGEARAGKIPAAAHFDIIDLFSKAGTSEIAKALATPADKISMHKLDEMTSEHANCLHYVLTTASATEELCVTAKFPEGAGFTSAFLRHLGMMLIAWNFPHLFRRAFETAKRGASVDEELLKLLGYSPRTLAVVVARQWGVSDEMLYVLGDSTSLTKNSTTSSAKIKEVGNLLIKSCQVGDMLAQLAHPEMRGESLLTPEQIATTIEKVLGPDGLKRIQKRTLSMSENYLEMKGEELHRIFGGRSLPTEIHPQTTFSVYQGSTELQNAISALNAKIVDGVSNKNNLVEFTRMIVPLAGFAGGCVYTFDFDQAELSVRYKFGEYSLLEERIACAPLIATPHSITRAFRSNTPILIQDEWNATSPGNIAQVFGVIQRVGVLYLEAGPELHSLSKSNLLALYSTLWELFRRCLGVK